MIVAHIFFTLELERRLITHSVGRHSPTRYGHALQAASLRGYQTWSSEPHQPTYLAKGRVTNLYFLHVISRPHKCLCNENILVLRQSPV
jgi:hypothetical protein